MTEQEKQDALVSVEEATPSPDAATPTENPAQANATGEEKPSQDGSLAGAESGRPTAGQKPAVRGGRNDRKVDVIPPKKVVRKLAVGMEMEGVVKRIANFGAFIDIGVGRDGLVHISEVSVKRINRIEDVLTVGDEVRVWVKELDRARNRISLTMISPDTKTVQDLHEGDVVTGTVTRIVPYGAFVDLGVEREGMLHIREMGDGFIAKPEDVVKVGESTEVRIHQIDRRRGRIDLSLKGLRPVEELVVEKPSIREEADAEPTEEEPPTVIELAFEKARRAQRIDKERRKRRERQKRDDHQSRLDDIIERTLQQHQGDRD